MMKYFIVAALAFSAGGSLGYFTALLQLMAAACDEEEKA